MQPLEDVAIFWDIENCPVPATSDGYAAANSIISLARPFGRIRLFRAYLEIADQLLLRSELQSSGVSLIDCPRNGRKDVADKMMIVDMLTYAIDNPTPCTILVISGDRDFAYALSMLKVRHYQMVLVALPNAHRSLTAQACVRFDWPTTVSNSTIRSSAIPSQAGTLNPSGYNHISAASREASSYHSSIPLQLRGAHQTGPLSRPESDETPAITQILLDHSRRSLFSSQQLFQGPTAGQTLDGQENVEHSPAANFTTSQDDPGALADKYGGSRSNSPAAVLVTSYANPRQETSLMACEAIVEDVATTPELSASIEHSTSLPSPQHVNGNSYIDSDAAPTSLDSIESDTAKGNYEHESERDEFPEGSIDIEGVAEARAGQVAISTEEPVVEPLSVDIEPSSPVPLLSSNSDLHSNQPLHTLATVSIDVDQGKDMAMSGIHKHQTSTIPINNGSVQQLPPDPVNEAGKVSTAFVGLLTTQCQSVTSSGSEAPPERQDVDAESTFSVPYSSNLSLDSSLTFDKLIGTLRQLKDGGLLRPLRSTIALLVTPHEDEHETIALTEIIETALTKGLIVSGGEGPQGWIGLPSQSNELRSTFGVPEPDIVDHSLDINLPSSVDEATIASPPARAGTGVTTTQHVLNTMPTVVVNPVFNPPVDNYTGGSKTKQKPITAYYSTSSPKPPIFLSQPSSSSSKKPTTTQQRQIPSHFVILVQTLQAHRNNGENKPLRTEVALQIANDGKTYERAGVTKFRQYIKLAEQEGIVELGGADLYAWIRLRSEWYNAIPARGPQTQKVAVPSEFSQLVKALQALRQEGILKPLWSQVASQLSKTVYKKAGVTKFGQYADLAADEGIVKIGGYEGEDWISLKPKWHHAAV